MLNEKAENLKKDLAEVILRTEVTYCFNTEFDFNFTFDEASDKLNRIVEELRITDLNEIIFNYGTEYFPEELRLRIKEYKEESLSQTINEDISHDHRENMARVMFYLGTVRDKYPILSDADIEDIQKIALSITQAWSSACKQDSYMTDDAFENIIAYCELFASDFINQIYVVKFEFKSIAYEISDATNREDAIERASKRLDELKGSDLFVSKVTATLEVGNEI